MADVILNSQVTATADTSGNISFLFPPAPMNGQVNVGTVSIAGVPAYAQFTATTSPGQRAFGSWQGSQPFGLVETRDLDRLLVTGVNLIPNLKYTAVWAGRQTDSKNVPPVSPAVLPAAPTFNRAPLYNTRFNGTASLLQVPTLAPIGALTTICDVSNFAGVRCSFTNNGTTAVQISILFLDSQNVITTGRHDFILAGSGTPTYTAKAANFQIPVLGDRMNVTIATAPSGGNNQVDVRINGTNSDRATWSEVNNGSTNSIGDDSMLAVRRSGSIAALGTVTVPTNYIYAGPVSLALDWTTAPSPWIATVTVLGYDGASTEIAGIDNTASAGNKTRPLLFYLPPYPAAVTIQNGSAGAQTLSGMSLTADLWR